MRVKHAGDMGLRGGGNGAYHPLGVYALKPLIISLESAGLESADSRCK